MQGRHQSLPENISKAGSSDESLDVEKTDWADVEYRERENVKSNKSLRILHNMFQQSKVLHGILIVGYIT